MVESKQNNQQNFSQNKNAQRGIIAVDKEFEGSNPLPTDSQNMVETQASEPEFQALSGEARNALVGIYGQKEVSKFSIKNLEMAAQIVERSQELRDGRLSEDK